MESYTLKEGLGDCLIAAAAIEAKARLLKTKIGYNTNELLHKYFESHPYIELKSYGTQLLWPSQTINPSEYFNVHTVQRFAKQIGVNVFPSTTVNLYSSGKTISHIGKKDYVCINVFSAERNRRFIDNDTLQSIQEVCSNKKIHIKYIGTCDRKDQIQDIDTIIEQLINCTLFIGPVSFCYHLASAIKVPCLLLGNYMPSYKFSNFTNTYSLDSSLDCIHNCENDEKNMRNKMNCWNMCKAIPDKNRVIKLLEELI